jgi:hypothetical protein
MPAEQPTRLKESVAFDGDGGDFFRAVLEADPLARGRVYLRDPRPLEVAILKSSGSESEPRWIAARRRDVSVTYLGVPTRLREQALEDLAFGVAMALREAGHDTYVGFAYNNVQAGNRVIAGLDLHSWKR